LGVGALLSLVSFSCKGMEIDGGGGLLFRSAGEDLSARRENKTWDNMVASVEEKKRKETNRYRGFLLYYAIWWEGKTRKNCLIKAYFWWIESVLASHGPYL
jgi:hypothetical protein